MHVNFSTPIQLKLVMDTINAWWFENSKTVPLDCQRQQNFSLQPHDIFVAGPVKCGTTWLQQIVHQIRTKGDESFRDIYDVVW